MDDFIFVSCISQPEVAARYLLASPCLKSGGAKLVAFVNARSAAEAVNQVLDARPAQRWLVWVHQDVFLPGNWLAEFANNLAQAQVRWPNLAVAGVYGVAGAGAMAVRAGHVLDRGRNLQESAELPVLVDSLDELLLAVRTDAGLRLDAALGFDFYATDVVLQAQEQGLCAAVVHAFCEHWSDTPSQGVAPQSLVDRIGASGDAFERKWAHRLPITTPCFPVEQPGDVRNFLRIALDMPALGAL